MADVDVLLVGPTGAQVMLVSDAVGPFATRADNATLTFDDAAAGPVPQRTPPSGVLPSGSYRPSNYPSASEGDAVGPSGLAPLGTAMAEFNGLDPNGTWGLYVFDDSSLDSGSIARGWSLSIKTEDPKIAFGFRAHQFPDRATDPRGPEVLAVVAEGRGNATLSSGPRSGPWRGTVAVEVETTGRGDLTVLTLAGKAAYLKSEDGRRISGPAEVKRSNLNGCRDGANASIVLKESRLKKGKDLATVKYCGRTFSWSSPADRGFNVSVRVA